VVQKATVKPKAKAKPAPVRAAAAPPAPTPKPAAPAPAAPPPTKQVAQQQPVDPSQEDGSTVKLPPAAENDPADGEPAPIVGTGPAEPPAQQPHQSPPPAQPKPAPSKPLLQLP
jgi:hypothetical protein